MEFVLMILLAISLFANAISIRIVFELDERLLKERKYSQKLERRINDENN